VLLALPPAAALTVVAAPAQQASVQGIVIDRSTAQPLLGASVVLDQGGREVRSILTDRSGLYQIARLTPGLYRLRIVLLGYSPHEETIDLSAAGVLTANRALAPDPLQLEGVNVTHQGPGAVDREMGGQTITAPDLGRIPTPAAGGDLASYLRTLPGVVSTGDRGGQLFIRGGTPTENLVLMDGMLVYQPFHITGFFSVFPEELVHRADFFAGGFGPKYSGRTSSVLDVQMRDGNRNEPAVAGSLGPFLAEAVVEGPLFGQAQRSAYIVSARRSLLRETSPWLLGEDQRLGFDSFYGKVSSFGSDGASRCSLTGMHTNDRGGLDPDDEASRVDWSNVLFGGRCTSLAGETFVEGTVAFSRVTSHAITRGASEFSSATSLFSMRGDFSRTVGRVRLNFGAFSNVEAVRHDFLEFRSSDQTSDSWQGGGLHAEAEIPLGQRFRLLPGATGSWYPASFSPTLEPRLRLSWQPPGLGDGEVSAAVGLYRQRIAGISDRRDVSSVFTAWMSPPDGRGTDAIHAQASWQQPLTDGLFWSIDGYYRWMSNVPVATWSTVASFTPDLSVADGVAHGADTRLELRRGRFYGFAAYGYGWMEYETSQESFGVWFGEPVQRYQPPHDRRHQANALASLDRGPYTFAARWEIASGFPFTRPVGFDEWFDFRHSLPNVIGRYGQTRLHLDRPYNGRLPPTHRLDLSAARRFTVRTRRLELHAGVINAYDQSNMFYYDIFSDRRIDQLPFAPYLSLRLQPGPGSGQ
jgi:hypothetical protein